MKELRISCPCWRWINIEELECIIIFHSKDIFGRPNITGDVFVSIGCILLALHYRSSIEFYIVLVYWYFISRPILLILDATYIQTQDKPLELDRWERGVGKRTSYKIAARTHVVFIMTVNKIASGSEKLLCSGRPIFTKNQEIVAHFYEMATRMYRLTMKDVLGLAFELAEWNRLEHLFFRD